MSIQDIKKRTKAVKNTLQITKAMELIASIKMRSAIAAAETSRQYSAQANILLDRLADEGKTYRQPLLQSPEVDQSLIVVSASDKGLCGSFNTEIFKAAHRYISGEQSAGHQAKIITVGQKATNHFVKISSIEVIASFPTIGENVDYRETLPLGDLILEEFTSAKFARTVIVYAHFHSIVRQEAIIRVILPIGIDSNSVESENDALEVKSLSYKFEPDPATVLDYVLPELLRTQVYQALLESNASEHAARMVAMKNATDAGKEIVTDLEFTYNRLRQERITTELSEIASGSQALS